jgi:cell division protein FtsB
MNTKPKKSVKFITVAVVAVLFVLMVVLVVQFVQITHLKNSQDMLQNQLDQLEQNIVSYNSENDYLESAEFIEDYAREVLGYGLLGETRFR